MIPFFAKSENQTALLLEAKTWLGTPFVTHGKMKGAGVDCGDLASLVYKAVGLDHPFDLAKYQVDIAGSFDIRQMLDPLDALPSAMKLDAAACRIDPTIIQLGDFLVFHRGSGMVHTGIVMVWPNFLHVLRLRGVMFSMITDTTYLSRLTAIYRPIQVP